MRMVCEAEPAGNVPLLHDCEIVEPPCVCALAVNGDPEGNDVAPGIAVAVCANPSLFIKRIEVPTGTVTASGEYPSGCIVKLTSIVVTPALAEDPDGVATAPGVQAVRKSKTIAMGI